MAFLDDKLYKICENKYKSELNEFQAKSEVKIIN
jgi:hypothetical protein